MLKSPKTILFTLLVMLLAVSANAVALYAPGLNTIDYEITLPRGSFVGGFDILPNGNYLINDGRTIREISPNSGVSKTLYTFASSVYGSFAKYNSSDGKVYFGESSKGNIWSFSYTNPANVSLLTNIANNFDIDFRQGQPYVVACDSSWSESQIYLLGQNTNDLIATCDGPSGPIAFDSAGNLTYIPASYGPTTEIIKWSNAEIAGAIGTNPIGRTDADVLATIESGYGSGLTSTGDLLFTNNSLYPSGVQIYKNDSVSNFATFVQPGGMYPFISSVRENPLTGAICAVVSYSDSTGASHTVVSSMAVPEPSSLMALCSLIGLVGSVKLLRSKKMAF